jgi:hypothetical protein
MDPEHSLVNPPQHTIPIQFKEVTPLQRALFRYYLFILMLIMFRSNNNMWKWAMLSKFRRNMPLPFSAVSPKRGQHSPFPYHPACHYAAQGLILTMNHHEDVKYVIPIYVPKYTRSSWDFQPKFHMIFCLFYAMHITHPIHSYHHYWFTQPNNLHKKLNYCRHQHEKEVKIPTN